MADTMVRNLGSKPLGELSGDDLRYYYGKLAQALEPVLYGEELPEGLDAALVANEDSICSYVLMDLGKLKDHCLVVSINGEPVFELWRQSLSTDSIYAHAAKAGIRVTWFQFAAREDRWTGWLLLNGYLTRKRGCQNRFAKLLQVQTKEEEDWAIATTLT